MKRQGYIKPAMQVVKTMSATLLVGSSVMSIGDGGSGSGIGYGGAGGSGEARSREFDWDE